MKCIVVVVVEKWIFIRKSIKKGERIKQKEILQTWNGPKTTNQSKKAQKIQKWSIERKSIRTGFTNYNQHFYPPIDWIVNIQKYNRSIKHGIESNLNMTKKKLLTLLVLSVIKCESWAHRRIYLCVIRWRLYWMLWPSHLWISDSRFLNMVIEHKWKSSIFAIQFRIYQSHLLYILIYI